MLDVKIHKDFFNMETELMFGLTKRQLTSIIVGVGTAGVVYLFVRDMLTASLIATIIGVGGFMKYDIIMTAYLKLIFEPKMYIFKKSPEEVEIKLEKIILENKINSYLEKVKRGAKYNVR